MPTPLTSDALNSLVFRYLTESGFTHSAFVLGYEAGLNKSPIDGNMVPPGALVTFVQKGIQYLAMEANLSKSDMDDDDGDFSFLNPLDLLTKDANELMQLVRERKKNQLKSTEKKHVKEHDRELGTSTDGKMRIRLRKREKDPDILEQDKQRKRLCGDHVGIENVTDQDEKANAKHEESGNTGGPKSMDIFPTSTSQDVTILEGHTSEVYACAWSPTGSLLASGSGDSTARIWTIADRNNSSSLQNGASNVLVLEHVKSKTSEGSQDVTTVDWNPDGTVLATGFYDGKARIWTKNGERRTILSKHREAILSIKWNKKGDYLLTGSCDKTAIVWDMKTYEWKQQFSFHSGPTLDVDWRNDNSFATSSIDCMIYVCKIGENWPIKVFSGHQEEVNCVKWDPTGSVLASCSDDTTIKIWSMKHDKHILDLREHSKMVYTIRWSPTGPGTINPNQELVLASASFDSTVKLWDVNGRMLQNLIGHRKAVYALAFSPNGEYLASGSLDQSVHVWSVKEGKMVKTCNGGGRIYEVCWNKEGDKIAACTSSNTVCIMDFRM